MSRDPRFSTRAFWRIARLAVFGTLACVALSLMLNYLLLFSGLTAFGRGIASAIILPVLIGAPLLVFIGRKLQEIRRYRHDFNREATYDRVTGCFKGVAFSSIVERRAGPETGHGPRKGAFLLVDAERMRKINMRHGFDWGEEALRLVAATIRSAVRGDDIVGRLGDSEFAVFLPGADETNAREVGKRIKARVTEAVFMPEGDRDPLEVSVGGIVFEGALGFSELFRAAGRPLSDARQSRDVVLSHWRPDPGREERSVPLM